jgi:hypothetical protein
MGEEIILKNSDNTEIGENAFWREKVSSEVFKNTFLMISELT